MIFDLFTHSLCQSPVALLLETKREGAPAGPTAKLFVCVIVGGFIRRKKGGGGGGLRYWGRVRLQDLPADH